MFDPSNEDDKSKLKKDGEELKNVFKGFAQEIGDALKTWGDVGRIQDLLQDVDNEASKIVKSFGLGRDNIVNLKSAMTEAVTQVTLLGGSFEDITRIQQKVGEALGRNVILATDSYEKLYAAESVSGQKAEVFVAKMKEVGVSTYKASAEMEKIINSAREIGVNVSVVTKNVLDNMDKIHTYNFEGGVEGLSKMAAHASSIGLNMKETFAFADKVFKPEGAIETAAALQRLGVTQSQLLDPLKLMDLSRNDPAELQRQMAELGKGFVELNEKGQFQIAPGQKERLMEIAKEMGVSYNEMAKMSIGAKELDDKMSKIKFPDTISEEQRQFVANMAEMNEKGEYVIQYKGEAREVNDLLKEFGGDKKALEQFMKDQEPKTMEELAKEQLSTQQQFLQTLKAIQDRTGFAVAGSEMGEAQLDLVRKGYKAVADSFEGMDIKGIRKTYDEGMLSVLGSVKGALTGEGSVEDVFKKLGEAGQATTDFLKGGVKEGLESIVNTSKILQSDSNAIIQVLNASVNKVVDLGKSTMGMTESTGNVTGTVNSPTTNVSMDERVTNPQTQGTTNTGTQNNGNQIINTSSDVNMKITLEAPPNIDTAQLSLILNKPEFQQELAKAVKNAMTNNNLTPYGNPNEKK